MVEDEGRLCPGHVVFPGERVRLPKSRTPRSIDVAKEPSEFWSHDADLNFSFPLKPRKVRPQQISSPRNYSTKRNCRVHDFRGVSLIEGHGIRKICGCGCCSLNPKGLFEALAAKVSHLDVAQCVLGERSLNECSCRTIKPESHRNPLLRATDSGELNILSQVLVTVNDFSKGY